MITTGFESRVKIQQIVENQLPEFILSETPKTAEFLKQYYISQEFQGGVVDIAENLDQYKNLNMLTPEVISGISTLTSSISTDNTVIYTNSTKGFPSEYGLLKIDDEIITYTGIGTTSFIGCKRGFSGIVNYHSKSNPEELEFSTSKASAHTKGVVIQNLSSLFLKEFYKKLKQALAPGFEDVDFVSELNVNNFIKEIKSFYQSKGTEQSFKILYNVLYGIDPTIINLEDFLIKPSSAEYTRREVLVCELISGTDPNNLVGQTIKNLENTASAPVSEVEIIKRNNKNYYKIYLFAGYEDKSLIQGTFEITPSTKVIDEVEINSSVITVDSTIGFESSGKLICGNNTITYKNKSINQFFECTGITSKITPGSSIRSNKLVYGYENGDTSKKVELRITGVLSKLENQNNINFRSVGDVISVKNIGEKIENPSGNKSNKEIIFNSWIYNTSSRYEIESFVDNQVVLYEFPDKSSLKVGDYVNILHRNSEDIVVSNARVVTISNKTISLDKNITGIPSNKKISLRRNLNYASSSGISLQYPKITANIQNTYNKNSEYLYVASNSLPDYNISKQVVFKTLNITSTSILDNIFSGFIEETGKYTILSFPSNVSFITGDAVVYTGSLNPIDGLVFNQTYYVEVIETSKNKIKLYNARSFIGTNNCVQFSQSSDVATHTFTLEQQANNKKLSPKKILRKIPLDPNIKSGTAEKTIPGPIGILVNGVEIINYKSYDKIYYGPLTNLQILNPGDDYDIVNPPIALVSNPTVSTGTTALIDLVIRGDLKSVIVDPNGVGVEKVLSATISGGNGSGVVLEPIIEEIFNETSFNAQISSLGGGINIDNETISFLEYHNLQNGTPIVYNSNGNQPIGIGTFGGSNTDQDNYLINGAIYFPEIINTSSIKIYNTLFDLNSGINTVGFTTTNLGGIHKFRTLSGKKVLTDIKVLNSGFNYENRSLKINSSGISTISSLITFSNHGFNHGDLVQYRISPGFGSTTSESITGLSTSNQYYVIKIDNSNFRLSDAGNKTLLPSKDDFNRGKHVILTSSGSGQQIFEYPPIKLNLEIEYSDSIGIITATPVFKGKIVDAYLYEPGTDYGSKILNLHRKPIITVKNGSSAELKPIIFDGKIKNVEVQNGGYYYSSSPELVVNGDGIGAKLRAEVVDGRIVNVIVVNSGINYDSKNTSIYAKPSGKNGLLSIDVRDLTVNNLERFSDEILVENDDHLSYGIVGYSTNREGVSFSDDGQNHSKIIGWSYDGHPIYGPYGYVDPDNENSQISLMKSGYVKSSSNIRNRPSGFDVGFFVEDYVYTENGTLDEYNGRFSKTPDFPYGTYAYYVGVSTNLSNNTLQPEFPYFIGNKYRSKFDTNINESQNFNFNSSTLVRNTFPYRINQTYSNNDFIIESNKILKQTSLVESVSEGNVEDLIILEPGNDYAVNDVLIFDDSDTEGTGISALVSDVQGKTITNISATTELYENTLVLRKTPNQIEIKVKPYHTLIDQDIVEISGISTNSIKNLSDFHRIGISSNYSSLVYDVPSNAISGLVTDIYVSPFPQNISIGSSASIESETISILNVFKNDGILRVSREVSTAHTAGTRVNFYNDKFTINLDTEYFDSRENDIIYFNPTNSIAVGVETGTFSTIQYSLGNITKPISVETQSIYLPNHPFKTNQRVLLSKPYGSSSLLVRNTSSSPIFNVPSSGYSQYVYIINKGPDTIGIVTQVGLTTTSSGLFFDVSVPDNDYYYFESNYNQVTTDVKKIVGQVSVSTDHNLNYGDKIVLIVNPGLSTGIGTTSSSISIKYDSSYDKILINPVGFTSSAIDITTNKINIPLHGFKTGQKVFYNSEDLVASGLSTGGYFINRFDQNHFYLCDTYVDSISSPPKVVSIGNSGGLYQKLSLINPQLEIVKNNDIVFDVSDNSLLNYNLKFFFDSSFKNEFVSLGNTSSFSVSKIGTSGITTFASVIVKFNDNLPNNLYYTLEKSGSLVSIDNEVENASEILYKNSVYNNEYTIFGVGTTSFNITLKEIPEKYNYSSLECDEIRYYTNSTTTKGGIEKINLVSGGIGYKKLPFVSGISTFSLGSNAIIKTKSSNIGQIEQLRILNEGFEYSSDKTLRPIANIPRLIRLQKSNKITNILTSFGGRNFISNPTLVLVNDSSRKKVTNGVIQPKIIGSSINSVNIIDEPKGLESVNHTIFTEKNTNGVGIERVLSYVDGIVECEISTPALSGFIVAPFKVGDYVFVEGIQKQSITDVLGVVSSPGTGFNSSDNGYRFFEVVEFINSNPAVLKYNIGKYTSNAGIPVTIPSSFASIVNKNNYPTFELITTPSIFYLNERLLVNGILSDLVVESSDKNLLTVSGDYDLTYGDILTGENSGSIASVDEDINLSEKFNVNYSKEANYGWKNDIGKLNNSYQVLPDNDYYQNLSYSIKTSGEQYKNNKVITFDISKDSINRLVHPTGLKNFADVGITSRTSLGIGSDQGLTQVLDFISEKRVDTFNNFDLALDYLPSEDYSDAILLKNRKLADYIQCISNRVLQIDDISSRFSSAEFNRDNYIDAYEYSITDQYSKFLVQITDEYKTILQASELVVLNNYDNTYTLNKADLYTSDDSLGTLSGTFGEDGNPALRFDPTDPYIYSYKLKIYRDYFSSSSTNIGVGYTDLGFLRLDAQIDNCSTIGIKTDIFQAQFASYDSIYSNVFIRNEDTLEMDYFEILAYHDGTDSHISEYYFNTQNNISGTSFGFIGTFGVTVDSGIFKLNFTNNTNANVTIKSKTVGFGITSLGIGTYRYLVEDQNPGSERSARLESSYKVSIGNTTITTYDLGTEGTLKSLVRVGVGSTVALHQLLIISDNENVNMQQYPFLSVGTASTSGIGTFGVETNGINVYVKFYPDQKFSSDNILIQNFNQFLYFDTDEYNVPPDLNYGIGIENLDTAFYGSLNRFGKDRLEFDLNYNGVPIFEKVFNPNNSNTLNKSTGVFTIQNHFFQTGEELTYTPSSTLLNVPAFAVGIDTTLVGGKVFTGDFIVGFSTITGISTSDGFNVGDLISGPSVSVGTTIVSIGSTFTYFVGDVTGVGSTIITGIGNTTLLSIGSSIFSLNNVGVGTIISVGINSVTASQSLTVGSGLTFYTKTLNTSLKLSNVSTGTTIRQSYNTGITTNIMPSKVYAIRVDNDTFKLTGTSGGSNVGFTFTSSGSGNYHKLTMKKNIEKCLITVNGVNQYPILWTPINHKLRYNGGSIGTGVTFIALSGISSIAPRDLIKIDNEYVKVINVGFGTTNIGPITGIGTIPIVQVSRSFVGSSATTHLDETEARIYRGSFNIVGNKLYFTEAPDGKGNNNRLDPSGLALPKSTFNGRVFLRRNYEFNKIYDDLSNQFTGIGRTFNLTTQGNNTSGIEAGSGLVFINDVFQTPQTENNSNNNYILSSSNSSGISTITFTSVTRPNTDDIIIVPSDVNQNQVPRGGLIISLGSTGGLGYAPLVGAAVTAVIGAGGSITAVGIGTTDIVGSGYHGSVSIAITEAGHSGTTANIIAIVGAGGTLAFNIVNGGTGYANPTIKIDSPSYENLAIQGISRLSIGNTITTGIGLSISVNVGESSIVGTGRSFFEVKSFNITKPGYGFQRGDKFRIVGLVTDARLASPFEELILTVEETFNDSFACWQLGELDYIDSTKSLQNGSRKRFPLMKNNELLSFEKDKTNVESNLIDFNSVLLIYINGVMQEPGVSYSFEGGTTFIFKEAPKYEDNIAIFFYRGTRDIDSNEIKVYETVKPGDILQLDKNDQLTSTIAQKNRVISLIQSADVVETGTYLGDGIDENNYRPIHWSKQKADLIINEDYQSKARDSLESLVVPAARIIKNISKLDTEIFVDNAQFFKYEENDPNTSIIISNFEGLIVDSKDPISAGFTAIVSGISTISSIGILTGGYGYTPGSTIQLKIAKPIGIGTTATATATVSAAGTISSINITNPGSGYTSSNPPSIICTVPSSTKEFIGEIRYVEGFSGIITGISTCTGTGSNPLAIKLNVLYDSSSDINSLLQGYPIFVTQTAVGQGVTSINNSNSDIVSIGSTFIDNIYIVNSISRNNLVGVITCNILSTSNTVGILTNSDFCGRFSWGRLYGMTRSSNSVAIAVTGYTVNSGLTTFPQIIRRGYGLRNTGGLRKELKNSEA